MTFQPGQSGNPNGIARYRECTEQLRLAVNEVIKTGHHKGKKKLRRICEKVIAEAMKGEPWAATMVFDRIEGRPLQIVDQSVTLQASQVFVDLLRELNERRAPKLIEHEASKE